jgi:hypothetical protein
MAQVLNDVEKVESLPGLAMESRVTAHVGQESVGAHWMRESFQ